MNIQQNIIKMKYYKIIEKMIIDFYNGNNIDLSIFFPKKKSWFEYYLKILKKIIKYKNETLSLIYYKQNGYIEINKVLIHKSLPYIFMYSEYDNNIKNIFETKTKLNTKQIYIFPDDIKKISEYKKNALINHIKNIDFLYSTFYKDILLDDCVIIRGMNNKKSKKNIQ